MTDQGTVDRNKLKVLDLALGEKQTIERISGGRLGIQGVEDVGDVYVQDLQASRSQVDRHLR